MHLFRQLQSSSFSVLQPATYLPSVISLSGQPYKASSWYNLASSRNFWTLTTIVVYYSSWTTCWFPIFVSYLVWHAIVVQYYGWCVPIRIMCSVCFGSLVMFLGVMSGFNLHHLVCDFLPPPPSILQLCGFKPAKGTMTFTKAYC